MTFAEFLRDWLAAPGRTAYRLAQDAEVSQSLVSRWVHPNPARRVLPTPHSLTKLAPVMGVPQRELLVLCGYDEAESLSEEDNVIRLDMRDVSPERLQLLQTILYAVPEEEVGTVRRIANAFVSGDGSPSGRHAPRPSRRPLIRPKIHTSSLSASVALRHLDRVSLRVGAGLAAA